MKRETRISALAKKMSFPREFVLWCINHVHEDSRESTFIVDGHLVCYTLNDLYDYWMDTQKKILKP